MVQKPTRMADVQMPRNLNAEFALTGGLLGQYRGTIHEVRTLVDPADFFDPKLGQMYRTIVDLHDSGDTPNASTLKTILGDECTAYLREVADRAEPISQNMVRHARAIRQAAVRRKRIEINWQAIQCDADGSAPVGELHARQMAALETLAGGELTEHLVDLKDYMPEYQDLLSASENARGGISTGIEDLDRRFNLMYPGQLVVVAAQTSIGKTQFALQLIRQAALYHRKRTLLLTLEMSKAEVIHRLVGMTAGIDPQKLEAGWEAIRDRNERQRASEAIAQLADWKLTIFEPPTINVRTFRAISRLWKAQRPDDCGLIVVDYLQLLEPENPKDNRTLQVGRMTRGLKIVARELRLPVVVLSQLNRQVDQIKGPPRLCHLRESGNIEQDANRVLFLYRPEFESGDGTRQTVQTENATVVIAKNRGGKVGCVKTLYRQCIGFVDREEMF